MESEYFRHTDSGAVIVVELTPLYNTPGVTNIIQKWFGAEQMTRALVEGKDCLFTTYLVACRHNSGMHLRRIRVLSSN